MSEQPQVEREREWLSARGPEEYRDGARCGFLQKYEGQREAGGYPIGFRDWPLERHNSWFAGYNLGRQDRHRPKLGRGHHG